MWEEGQSPKAVVEESKELRYMSKNGGHVVDLDITVIVKRICPCSSDEPRLKC